MSEQRIRAPEFPEQLEWFNTESPLTIAGQRGKVILLDFWTYCCINCMHVLPDLSYLEHKYPDGLTVIGIHSPKFSNERVAENVQKAINRYDIRRPVANDPALGIWQQYGIRAWPSIAFIDPDGYVTGILAGEGRRKQLDKLIQEALQQAERTGIRRISRMPVRLQPEPPGILKFPGRVLATADRLYISDSGHHRVLEVSHEGRVLRRYGSGTAALIDGREEEASFNNPQGLALVNDTLYVADTGNHAIRRIRLKHREVETVAGTGKQGRHAADYFEQPLRASLNSPWDLAYEDGILYIAMAGQHQLWSVNLKLDTLGVFAGSGREGLTDGDAQGCALAQPSGLSVSGHTLFVADSETSAVRAVNLRDGCVRTLVGSGLFEFGDADGVGPAARLQHPLDVAYDPARNTLWIADTYNHKIKKIDILSNKVSSLSEPVALAEPGGISLWEDTLWIADTNHHRIMSLDLVSELSMPVEIDE